MFVGSSFCFCIIIQLAADTFGFQKVWRLYQNEAQPTKENNGTRGRVTRQGSARAKKDASQSGIGARQEQGDSSSRRNAAASERNLARDAFCTAS